MADNGRVVRQPDILRIMTPPIRTGVHSIRAIRRRRVLIDNEGALDINFNRARMRNGAIYISCVCSHAVRDSPRCCSVAAGGGVAAVCIFNRVNPTICRGEFCWRWSFGHGEGVDVSWRRVPDGRLGYEGICSEGMEKLAEARCGAAHEQAQTLVVRSFCGRLAEQATSIGIEATSL